MHSSRTDELLDALNAEWAVGFTRLKEFERLFGERDHVEVLNRIGGAFFADVQQILWDDLLLRITRLTDPPRIMSKENLTVQMIPEFCTSDDLRSRVEDQIAVAKNAAEFARAHRNKRISHRDLAYAVGDSELPSTTLALVQGALDAVYAVLKTVNMALRRMHLPLEDFSGEPRAEAFLCRTDSLVDAVLCVEELFCGSREPKPVWDEDFARAFIRGLGATPTPENVRRIVNLRDAAKWLRASGAELRSR